MSFFSVVVRRKRDGESEEAFAARCGVKRTTLRNWRISQPTPKKLAHVAYCLGESPGTLLDELLLDDGMNGGCHG